MRTRKPKLPQQTREVPMREIKSPSLGGKKKAPKKKGMGDMAMLKSMPFRG